MADQHPANTAAPPADLAALGEWVDGLIQELAAHPDPSVGERAFALLNGVDALHRAALGRLVALLQAPGAAAIWAQARQDPVIRAVLLLYDLAQPPAGASGTPTPAGPPPLAPAPPIRHEPAPVPGKRALPMIAPGALPSPRPARWRDATSLGKVPPGTLHGLRIEGIALLLCNEGGELFAYEDACPDTPLALSLGQLDGGEIVCPWHGCRFEARSGRRTVHRGTGLRSFPVTVAGETIRVAVDAPGPAAATRPTIAVSKRS